MAAPKRNKSPAAATTRTTTAETNSSRMSNQERSSYFARREAAKVLRTVLHGDAARKAVASIKSLVYSPSVRNKKATFALVCQTLKHLPLIKEVLAASEVLNGKWKRQLELMYVVVYDILFGQAVVFAGAAEKFILLRKNALQTALARLCVRQNVKHVEELLGQCSRAPVVSRPRYVRVNLLKMDTESAFQELGKFHKVTKDDLVPDLLVFPSGTDLHNHPLVLSGSIVLQGKASCMVAVALGPEPGWEVLDACSAPGNKTVHLSALMGRKGKIIACELNKDRVKHLEDTVKRCGASTCEGLVIVPTLTCFQDVVVLHKDFLDINTIDPSYSKVRAILLDPSCSGSGMVADRLDHLLPSYSIGDFADMQRIKKLAAFQKRALEHALSFPSVARVVYSTCSIHQEENEDVIKSVLPLATALNFQLGTPFPQWPRRGLPVFEGSNCLLRTDLQEDKEGFFIAVFDRKGAANGAETPVCRKRETSKASNLTSVNSRCKKLVSQRRGGRRLTHPKKVVPITTAFLKKARLLSHHPLPASQAKN